MIRKIVCLGVLAAALVASVAIGDNASTPITYPATKGPLVGLRPTGVGLPLVGQAGTRGAGELPEDLRDYHDSGQYDRDLAAVGGAAKAYLVNRLAQNIAPAPRKVRRCKVRYRKTSVRRHHKRLYRRVKRCRKVRPPGPQRLTGRPAIVLDIDETSLSAYDSMSASNFAGLGNAPLAASGTEDAIKPVLDLYLYARANGVAVFFITGRPQQIQAMSESNLRSVGYDKGWDGLTFKPGSMGVQEFKSGERAKIQGRGYDIIENVGDQESDLDGGHQDRAFKIPNPFYYIAD